MSSVYLNERDSKAVAAYLRIASKWFKIYKLPKGAADADRLSRLFA